MKRVCSLLLVLVLLISVLTIPTKAASPEAISAAYSLYENGLFSGVGANADGTPNFDLDRSMTRAEAVTMLVRLLGKESAAKSVSWTTPFTDVAKWAKPYVGYAYNNSLTSGTSATTFGGAAEATETQYLTFILRALGYSSETDFDWAHAKELTDQLGITNKNSPAHSRITRGEAAIYSNNALSVVKKGTNVSLLGNTMESKIPDYAAIMGNAILKIVPFSSGNAYILDESRFGSHKLPYIEALEENGFKLVGYSTIEDTNGIADEFYNPTTGDRVFFDYDVVDDLLFVYISTGTIITKKDIVAVMNVMGKEFSSSASEKLAVKSVVLSDKVMSLIPGETIKIKGTCIPSNAILTLDWKSSNPSVATVKYLSSGQPYGDGTVVEAQINSIMPGTAVITATSSNGVEATCVITVYPDITAKAQAAVDLLRGALKHPSSLILHSVRAFRGSSTDVIEINYSAMNGFGGYNRGWFHYTGTVNGSVEYSVIDKYNYPFIEIDIRSLK